MNAADPRLVALVALAGGSGAVLRWWLEAWLRPRLSPAVPGALLIINTAGSLVLGLLTGAAAPHEVLAVVGTGAMGGFTTFSGASVDAWTRWKDGHHLAAVLTSLGMLALAVTAAAIGFAIGQVL